MLNYNLNIIDPSQQSKKNSDFRPYIYWGFENKSIASDNANLPANSFGTMSINAPLSNCINITTTQTSQFATDNQYIATASLSGSNWAVTGSTTMSLSIVGVPMNSFDSYYNYSAAVSASATAGNINSISGSVLKNNFTSSEFYNFFISGSIIHWKGNQYNPKVNYKVGVTTPSASYVSASFYIQKDSNSVNVVAQNYATASNSGSFNYEYAVDMSTSLTGISDYWASSYNFKEYTMSLVIPELTSSQQTYYTNVDFYQPFTATNNIPYNITASIELKPWTPFEVQIIAVGAGGAGGGSADRWVAGGGGAAGSYITASWYSPVYTTLDIVIGTGGTSVTASVSGSNGGDTTVYQNNISQSIIIAKGGGGGGSATMGGGGSTAGSNTGANDGGSGAGATGGGNQTYSLPATYPNNATLLSTTGSIGSRGGAITILPSSTIASVGGGGGGATGVGQPNSSQIGGAGGTGATNQFGTFCVGGDGGSVWYNVGPTTGANGADATTIGGGGNGAKAGTTVDGGGVSGKYKGGKGGNGIVIIKYRGPQIATGGTVTQELNYTIHTFTTSGTFAPTANYQCCHPVITTVDYLINGGGGAGGGFIPAGPTGNGAGGGAGGTVQTGSLLIPTSGQTFPVIVGAGGLIPTGSSYNAGGNGQSSSLFNIVATGGTGGGISNYGQGGSNSNYSGGSNYGGGGAGAASAGTTGTNGPTLPEKTAGNGGNYVTWYNGKTYGGGAGGIWTPNGGDLIQGTPQLSDFGKGGLAAANGASGSFGQTNGTSGSVVLRYNGNCQKGTGGTITYNNGYVYHTFTGSAAFITQY
jgi:hypothetical protein